MNLTPVYELRKRLANCVVVGASLVPEDFRLQRAMEAFAPYEKAAPVFARLGQMVRRLMAPDCPDRSGALLDAVSLADAILCTQGSVAVPGAPVPLEVRGGGRVGVQAPFSVLDPLIDALTTSGSGKFSLVTDLHELRPELFEDYRVIGALVKCLGASYSELAERAAEWLSEMGTSVLPLLQRDFDPKGRKDMVRRVQIVEKLTGSASNDFYLSQLETAEKDVRAALIFALRLDPDRNTEKLIELAKTEKGNCKKMALTALSRIDNPASAAFWTGDKRNQKLAPTYAPLATTSFMCTLTAQMLSDWLAPFEADPGTPVVSKTEKQLQSLLYMLPGKSGPEICSVIRRMADLAPQMDRKAFSKRKEAPFSSMVAQTLRQAILYYPAEDLLDLAEELRTTVNASFAATGITAALLRLDSEAAYQLGSAYLRVPPRIFGESKARVLMDATEGLIWSDKRNCLVFRTFIMDPMQNKYVEIERPMPAPLDPRWYRGMTVLDRSGILDSRVAVITPKNNPELCELVGGYLYQQGLRGVNLDVNLLAALNSLGWQKCEGLGSAFIAHYRDREIHSYTLFNFLRELPGDLDSRRKEWTAAVEQARRENKYIQGYNVPRGLAEEKLLEALENLAWKK